jgi:hypothetical protein
MTKRKTIKATTKPRTPRAGASNIFIIFLLLKSVSF